MKLSPTHSNRETSIKILFIHLLNDYSGSPKILLDTIFSIHQLGVKSKLLVGSGTEGFLSKAPVEVSTYWYMRTGFRIGTLFTYFLSQLLLLFKLLLDRNLDKGAVIFINTLLPFGAAIYGKLTGRQVVYHVHEISITPAPLKWLLTSITRLTSSLNIYVSDAHMKAMPIPGVPCRRVYNALDAVFLEIASASTYKHRHGGSFNILMVAYLRDYKGVLELLDIASQLLDVEELYFDLVVNDDRATIEKYFIGKSIPANMTIHPKTDDTTIFYKKASLVLNLSRVDQWVETFGLTILEAMSFAIPVIAPPVGGPVELVDDGKNGYLIDSRKTEEISAKIRELVNNPELCFEHSKAAREKSKMFSPKNYSENILDAISSVASSNVSQ